MTTNSPSPALEACAGDSGEERHEHLADRGLVDAIVERDQAALREAYSQHGSRVHAIVRGLCGDTCADDLTEEIFLGLWNNPERFDPERGSLRSYLLMQAHRRAIDILRSDSARAARETAQTGPERTEQPGMEAIALAPLERAELTEPVSALPVNERHPIVLAYFGGHTYRDIARLLAVPEGTIKSCIRNGLQRIGLQGASQLHVNRL